MLDYLQPYLFKGHALSLNPSSSLLSPHNVSLILLVEFGHKYLPNFNAVFMLSGFCFHFP